jgi:hypothetical protein
LAAGDPGSLLESYVKLYDDIINDKERHTQIVNGTAGIGKSAFLLYTLARCRCAEKSVLLHFHRSEKETAVAVFFPVNGKPLFLSASSPSYFDTFRAWYDKFGDQQTKHRRLSILEILSAGIQASNST